MDDTRSRQHTLYAAASLVLTPVALAFLVSCGSNASPSSSGSNAGAGTTPRTSEVAAENQSPTSVASTATSPAAFDDELPVEPPRAPGPQDFLCMRDPVAFDISQLTPTNGTPHKFMQAWRYVRSTTTIPGFMAVYSGTRNGPTALRLRVGAVYHASAGLLGFMNILRPSDPASIGLYREDPYHLLSPKTHGDFVVAMGKPRERVGFVVSGAVVDGRMSGDCGTLSDITVELTLPFKRNVGQPFGNSSIDEELGPLTADTDHDGKPDSWKVTFTGPSLEAMDFKL